MAQYTPSSTAGSSSGFGTSSPPPHLYDTSTSESSSGYQQSKSIQPRSGSKTKSTSGNNTDMRNQQIYRQQQQQHAEPSPSTRTPSRGGGNGNFKSAAALLVSSGNHSQGSGSLNSAQQPASPGRAAAPVRRSNNRHYHQDGAFSDVSAPASFPSAAAHYIMSQEQQQHHHPQQAARHARHSSRTSEFSSTPSRTPTKNDASMTETTVATQSEPGGYSGHSYYTQLTDHYSSSAAHTSVASPDQRRSSTGGNGRFAALEQYKQPSNRYEMERSDRSSAVGGDNRSQQSQLPLLGGTSGGSNAHHQQQRQTTGYSAQSRQPAPASSSSSAAKNPFTSPVTNRPGMGAKKMSVSERIKRLNEQKQMALENTQHDNDGYPDPEPNLDTDTMDDHGEAPQNSTHGQQSSSASPLSPFYQPSSVRPKKSTDMQPQQQLDERDYTDKTSPHDALSRFKRRSEANLKRFNTGATTAASSFPSNNNDIDAQSTNASTGAAPAYLPTAASSSRPEHLLSDGNDDEKPVDTSLGGVRRRKPLQQPAYNPQQQSQSEEKPRRDQQRNSDIGSPSRVQDLKRQLWTEDEQLNVSYEQQPNDDNAGDNSANNRYQRAARSLSPGQYRRSSESMLRPGLNGVNNNSNSNPAAAGFKSKFYQAAMAAQRGERTTTPPKARPTYENQVSARHPESPKHTIPGTPPRPQATSQHFVSRTAAGAEYPTPPRPSTQQQHSAIQATAPMPPTPPHHHSHTRSTSISPGRSRSREFSEGSQAILRKSSLQQPSAIPNAAPKHYPQEPYPVQHQEHPQQHPSQPTGEQPQPPYTNGGNASPPMSKEGKHYLSKLMVKLNSVSRDDPQAALAQIDAILRAASSGSRSPDMMDSHEVLMNAAAAAVGMPPLGAPHQHFPVFPGQPPAQQVHQQYAGPHRGTTFQNPRAHGYAVPPLLDQDEQEDCDNNANVEEDDDSDDETSVSSITDPTYRSEKPTHEQLHDMPPPKGISTALYRRPRPNGLQNYATPVSTPAVSGLELVQRHHQRQQVKKGHLPTAEHVHAANHNKVHPPPVITVTASADEQDATKVFTENLIKSSSAKNQPQELLPRQQQNHGIDPYQEHAQIATGDQQVLYHENQLPDQGAIDEQNQRAILDHQQEQQQYGRPPYQEQPEQTTTIDHRQRAFPDHHQQKQAPGTPQSQASSRVRQLQRQAMVGSETEAAQRSSSEHGMKYVSKSGESYPRGGQEQLHHQQHNQRQVAAPAEFLEQQRSFKHKSPGDNRERFGQSNPSHPSSQTLATKASSTNPFDNSMNMDDGDNKDTENPEYATRSIRKLDLFMSRKKRKETEELRQMAENEEEPQLAGEQLARKVRAWDELSTPVSMSKSADGSGKIGVSSPASAGGGSKDGSDGQPAQEMDAVNVSTANLSIGMTSSASKTSSRRSHPWNEEVHTSRLKIDFRDTSMDNALGIEAECYSQSQASPARDLRKVARMQQQKHQERQMRELEENERMHQQQMQAHAAEENERIAYQQQQAAMQAATKKEAYIIENEPARELRKERMTREALQRHTNETQSLHQAQAFEAEVFNQFDAQTRDRQPSRQLNEEQLEDRGYEVTPIYSSEQRSPTTNGTGENEYDENWNSFPSSTYFEAANKTKPKVVATLVDEDTQPVTMVRAPPPELPAGVVDAFANVPIPYDERPSNFDRRGRPPPFSNRQLDNDAMNVPTAKDTPPPFSHRQQNNDAMNVKESPPPFSTRQHGNDATNVQTVNDLPPFSTRHYNNDAPPPRSEASSGTSANNRGRRAFTNFLKKRGQITTKRSSKSPSPRKATAPLAHSVQNLGSTTPTTPTNSGTRGRRTASKSPAPNNRARSLSASSRNPNIAKKFSRLLKVYGSEVPSPQGDVNYP